MTAPEAMLWPRLRARGLGAPAFRRQHPLGHYILDFYCPAAKLAVEIDGMGHAGGEQAQRDARKDAWLNTKGITVHRVSAAFVLQDPAGAADGIRMLANDLMQVRAAAPSTASRSPFPVLCGTGEESFRP